MSPSKTVLFAVGMPALICGLVGLGLSAYLASSAPPLPQTVAEGVGQRAFFQTFELIRAGANPRQPIDMGFTGVASGRPIPVTPLMLAAARDDSDFVRLLTGLNIPWSEEEKHDAYCMAVALRSDVESLLGSPNFDRSTCSIRMDRLAAGSRGAGK